MQRWAGAVCLVTGASSGIGACLAKTLAVTYELHVVGCGRNVDQVKLKKNIKMSKLINLLLFFNKLNKLAAEIAIIGCKGSFTPIQCDVSKEEEILQMFKLIDTKFDGRLHIVVNNAGLAHWAPLTTGNTDSWREMLNVNVLAVAIIQREAVRLMCTNKNCCRGQIINICSVLGLQYPSNTANLFYSVTKHALRSLTEAFRREVRSLGTGIRVALVSPGITETDFFKRFGGSKGVQHMMSSPRMQPEEVVSAILSTLSMPDDASIDEITVRPKTQII